VNATLDVIGIDLGGTKIKAGIVGHDGDIRNEISSPTPVAGGKEAILDRLLEMIRQLRDVPPDGVMALGIGSAGRIDRETGQVLYATDNLPGWMGTPLKAVLEQTCSLPVFVENDVNAAALGEGWLGAGRGIHHYVLVTIGTGVGGALVHHNRLINGPRGGAGEVGHMILYPGGLPCNCGLAGCLEQYVSGTALNRLARSGNSEWNSRMVMERLEKEDPLAIGIIETFLASLTAGLVSIQNVYDPELIILGGGVADSHLVWWKRLEARLKQLPLPIRVVPAALGNQAGILGAARLAFDEMGTMTIGDRRGGSYESGQ
jgi:glucokinase